MFIISFIFMIPGVVKSFASVTLIRIVSRLLEFVLRVYLIREVLSPEILAQMVALDLIITTSLHVAKSCFKPSYQQVQSQNKVQNVLSSMNLMSIGVLVTLVSSGIVIFLQWHHKIQVKFVNETILIYGLCALVEAMREKYSVQFVLNYQYRKLAFIELVSYLPKTAVIFVAAKLGLFQKYGILVFGIGQLTYYGICLALTFYLSSYKIPLMKSFNVKLEEKEQQVYLDTKTKKILKQLSYISVLKLFLQQFQKIVLVFNNAVEDSSIYSLVSNLGSIIVRFVFAPLEEIAYNYYARGSEQESKKTLITLIKVIMLFSILCIGFGFRYAENVLYLLYGAKWVNEESVFGFQCFMILVGVMGINGAIDSFVLARADPVTTVPKLKYFTIVSTLIYIGSSLLLLHLGLGAAGLFLGNTVGMLAKIVINWNIQLKRHISLQEFSRSVAPSPLFIVVLACSMLGSYQVKKYMGPERNLLIDFGIGIILFGMCLLPLVYEYRQEIIWLIGSKWPGKQKEN